MERLRALRSTLMRIRSRYTETKDTSQAVVWFTDNVVIARPVAGAFHPEEVVGYLADDVAYMTLEMLRDGFLTRGGLAYGEHFMEPAFVFGPALVEAVRLEEDMAVWPRVLLSADAVSKNREFLTYYAEPENSPQAQSLAVDEDGGVFIDHLNSWMCEEDDFELLAWTLQHFKATIEAALAIHRDGRVFDKWKWLADFHNFSMSRAPHDMSAYRIEACSAEHRFFGFVESS